VPPVRIFPGFLYSFVQSDKIMLFSRSFPFHIFQKRKYMFLNKTVAAYS
jgi:hypothetical protein